MLALDLFHRQRAGRDLERELLVDEVVVEPDLGRIVPGAGVEDAVEPGPVNRRQAHRAGLAAGVKLAPFEIEPP